MMLVKKEIEYAGIKQPENLTQIKVEILGLKHVISQAEEKIASLEQAYAIAEMIRYKEAEESIGKAAKEAAASEEAETEQT